MFDNSVPLEVSTAYTCPIRSSGRVTVPFSPIERKVVLRPERSARCVAFAFDDVSCTVAVSPGKAFDCPGKAALRLKDGRAVRFKLGFVGGHEVMNLDPNEKTRSKEREVYE